MTWSSPVCRASRCSCVFEYRCSHFTLCCTRTCIQTTQQSTETTLMSNITSLAFIEESIATPFPLLCHHGSSLSEDTPHWPSQGCQGYNLSHSTGGDGESISLFTPRKENNIRLHPDCTLWRPPPSDYTHNYIHRVTSTQNKQSFKKLWLCKWPKTPQRKPRTKIINLSRADCSFASHSLATLWDAKTNSLDLHQQRLSAKVQ